MLTGQESCNAMHEEHEQKKNAKNIDDYNIITIRQRKTFWIDDLSWHDRNKYFLSYSSCTCIAYYARAIIVIKNYRRSK